MHSIATPALDVIHLVILSELLYGRYKQKQVCNCFRFKKKYFGIFTGKLTGFLSSKASTSVFVVMENIINSRTGTKDI